MSKGERKAEYFDRLKRYLETYSSIFIVDVDNVGSNQMHQIRKSVRAHGEILMGKNTMVRRALKVLGPSNPNYEKLLPYIKGNIGFVFTNSDLKEVRDLVVANRVLAPARAGAIAPVDVFVPAGNTGMEPGQTSFFQALGIPTKISRGTIEITNDVHLVKVGEKVGPSEATLLNKLNISPFTYGMSIVEVYDNGSIFKPSVLDITDDDLLAHFTQAITEVACVSLAANIPTLPAVPHMLINGFKDLLSISVASEYTFKESESIKELLDNPEALAAAAAAAAASTTAASGSGASTAAAAAAEPEPEEESDDDMGFGLFD
ncbi:60S acidic ribosomal protein P0 [Zancudomyces culisetae]|uniref:60S acidic ribosomal protein P0 n=1 Tax=Zancudomyces culisetae TaxID=1213189 RepID=A0A1R1PZJ7_ZANCU|nr:60S acidic ribosomal protein P0 [Zancudomyces culisetae]|eukprot:OMH86357.1 60S acidic ribosomal protein P0 [Zancudomyces culisetae]